jgi:tetratricopeptide (TPR) repeat protein
MANSRRSFLRAMLAACASWRTKAMKVKLKMMRALWVATLLVGLSAQFMVAGPTANDGRGQARHRPGPILIAAGQNRSSAWASPQGKQHVARSHEEFAAYQDLRNETDPRTKLAKAQAFLQKFPESEIHDLVYLQVLAAYHQLGDTAKAIEAGHQAVQANPASTVSFYNLGVEYTNLRPQDFNQAVWNLARAVALARAAQDSSTGEFEKFLKETYVKAHGSEEGLPAIIAQAAASPTAPPGFTLPDPPLYSASGVSPEDVVQGGLGSCYFHSTMAAIARTHPEKIQEFIRDHGDGTFTVRFADGKEEKTHTDDLRYARQSGFDQSKALWVGVLLRAYAQRALRESLGKAADKSDLFPLVKQYARAFMTTNDEVLLAYDRAIRAVVDQTGDINQSKLEANLKERLVLIPIPDEAKDSIVKLLESGGFFQTLAETVKQEGEVFGAYRAVGQGGIPIRVMETFLGGNTLTVSTATRSQVTLVLSRSFQSARPVVAPTRNMELAALKAQKPISASASDWYVGGHAYTVMGYDANAGTVTLRNPWANHPDPDGMFTIPLSAFLNAFAVVETTAP